MCAKKNPHGNSIYDLLIDLIFSLSPYQAERLYSELLPKYTKRARTKLYNKDGEEDVKGKVRLLNSQYQSLRTSYGDSYIKKAFTELTNYITFLEANVETNSNYKQRLKKYTTETHNILLTEGWVYEKCKQYVIKDRPKININPFTIEDFSTAVEYIKTIPESMRNSIDVQMLMTKFPELVDVPYEV